MMRFTVYSIPGSPYGRSVCAMLAARDADWQLTPVMPGTLKGEAHRVIHPFGRIPVLTHDDFRLYETQAILRYLDRILPGEGMTPADAREAARMDQAMGINDWYLFNRCAQIIVFERVVGPALVGRAPVEDNIAEAMPRAHEVFAILSDELGGRQWFAGDRMTLAELMLGPQLEMFRRAPEWATLVAGRANLVEWLDRVEAHPAMRATTWEVLAARCAA